MNRLASGLLAALCLAPLACSGGGGDSICEPMVAFAKTCSEQPGFDVKEWCGLVTCERSKEAMVACITSEDCDAGIVEDCLDEFQCTHPADCGTVADHASDCTMVSHGAVYDACIDWKCTDDKLAALACAAALPCDSGFETAFDACMTAQGCPTFYSP